MGTIYRAVFNGRVPVLRVSLKEVIPISLWDKRGERVKDSDSVDYQRINHIIDQYKVSFLKNHNNSSPIYRGCFIEFARNLVRNDFEKVSTQKKYETIINSLESYVKNELNENKLKIEVLRDFGFVKGYAKWLEKRRYQDSRSEKKKKHKTRLNYLVVIKTFVEKFNQLHPQYERIITTHYSIQVPKRDIEKTESRNLELEEVNKIINYIPIVKTRSDKRLDAKHHFLFQFFTSGLRVSDLLLLNYKHFVNGRVEFVSKKNGDKISIPFGYKSCKILSYFYPEEYLAAIDSNTLGEITLQQNELDEILKIDGTKKLELLTIEDMKKMDSFFQIDKTRDNTERLKIISRIIAEMEIRVAKSMSDLMSEKSPGLVFNYLNYEDFKDLPLRGRRILTEYQDYKLSKARAQYNSRLKGIGSELNIPNLSSHVSRHSFAYFMLQNKAQEEEISFALGHSSVEQTKVYLKQFPQKYADDAIRRFENTFELK